MRVTNKHRIQVDEIYMTSTNSTQNVMSVRRQKSHDPVVIMEKELSTHRKLGKCKAAS